MRYYRPYRGVRFANPIADRQQYNRDNPQYKRAIDNVNMLCDRAEEQAVRLIDDLTKLRYASQQVLQSGDAIKDKWADDPQRLKKVIDWANVLMKQLEQWQIKGLF